MEKVILTGNNLTVEEVCEIAVNGAKVEISAEAQKKLEEARAFDLPQGAGRRTILVCRKISHTPPQYPRGHGKERTSPL